MPGVYALALPVSDIGGENFDWIADIIYFGMTNSVGGLAARLKQFDNTIHRKEGHGGGCRVRYKHRDYDELTKKLFVSISPVECSVKSGLPADFLKMGEVAYLEYYCFAKFSERHQRWAEFNNPKAPKLTAAEIQRQ